MRFLKDVGFVIKRINFGEADRFLTLYTQSNGKMEVVAKGVRKITSKRSSYIEPLNLIRFQAIKGPKNYTLTEVSLIDTYEDSKKSLEQLGVVFFMCELLDKLCPEHQQNIAVFDLVLQMLERSREYSKQHIFDFQVNLLSTLGYWDTNRTFRDEQDVSQFIENIIERKLKTKLYF